MNEQYKYLIDTDFGDDIDDAFALLFAMELGLDIVGITTVFQDTELRARMVKKLLKLYGKGYESIPVYSGTGEPISKRSYAEQCLFPYAKEHADASLAPTSKGEEAAVDFIIDCCYKYGRDLKIIAIGPFSNIARVIKKDPKALSLADEVIIMGGAYFKQYADWNVCSDVEAAKIMFDNLSSIRCIGADVTHELTLDAEADRRILECASSEAIKYVTRLYDDWKRRTGKALGVLHDPLAVYAAAYPDICSYELSAVAVIEEGAARGMTLNTDAYSKAKYNPDFYSDFDFSAKHRLARTVDKERIICDFLKCFA